MNFVGKILVFLIFLASVVFMTGTFMVFATQKNWRDVVVAPQTGLKTQVSDRDAQITDLTRQIADLESRHARLQAERDQWLAASDARANGLQAQYEAQQQKLALYEEQQSKSVEQVKALTERLAKNDDELDQVRGLYNAAQKERDDAMSQVATLESTIAQQNGTVETLTARNTSLAEDIARYRQAVADNNIQLDGNIKVEGVITKIEEQKFVQLSIGSDDGLQPGKVLDVFRYAESAGEPKWLGKVEIVETDSDQAVAQIIPEFSQGRRMQVGDRVATLATP